MQDTRVTTAWRTFREGIKFLIFLDARADNDSNVEIFFFFIIRRVYRSIGLKPFVYFLL